MTIHAANINCSPGLRAQFDVYFCTLGQGLAAKDLTQDRLAYAARLDRLPDPALAAMGIARDDIPRIVFRDLFCL